MDRLNNEIKNITDKYVEQKIHKRKRQTDLQMPTDAYPDL